MRESGRPAGEGSMREFGRPAGNAPARGASPNRQEIPNRGGRNRPASTYNHPDATLAGTTARMQTQARCRGNPPGRGCAPQCATDSIPGTSATPKPGTEGQRGTISTWTRCCTAESQCPPARDDFDVDETLYGGKAAPARARDDFDVDETLYGGKSRPRQRGTISTWTKRCTAERPRPRVRDDFDVDETLYGGKAAPASEGRFRRGRGAVRRKGRARASAGRFRRGRNAVRWKGYVRASAGRF